MGHPRKDRFEEGEVMSKLTSKQRKGLLSSDFGLPA